MSRCGPPLTSNQISKCHPELVLKREIKSQLTSDRVHRYLMRVTGQSTAVEILALIISWYGNQCSHRFLYNLGFRWVVLESFYGRRATGICKRFGADVLSIGRHFLYSLLLERCKWTSNVIQTTADGQRNCNSMTSLTSLYSWSTTAIHQEDYKDLVFLQEKLDQKLCIFQTINKS